MTESGDHPFEMERNRKFTSEQAEALIAGRTPADDEASSELAGFFRAAKAVAHVAPDPVTEQLHLAAIADANQLTEPGTTRRFATRSRSREMLATILRTKVFKASAVAIAAVLATGGLAAAHTLPAPAQDAVAFVAGAVGIPLPHSNDHAADDHGNNKVKDGADHDGDTVADDNGNHRGQDASDDHGSGSEHGKSVSDDVHKVQDDDSLEGRDHGDAVSDAASQNRQDDENGHKDGDANDNGQDHADDDHSDQGQNGDHDSPHGQDDDHGSDDD